MGFHNKRTSRSKEVHMTLFESIQAWLTACEIVLDTEDINYSDREAIKNRLIKYATTGILTFETDDEKD